MNDFDPSDDLWNLLGKARKPEVSPFFARNVLRKVREQQEEPTGFKRFIQSFRLWRLSAAGAAIAVILAAGAGVWHQADNKTASVAQQFSANPDYEVIVQLDDLLAYQEDSVWLEPSTY